MTLSQLRNQPLTLSPTLVILAWAVTLFISELPDILLRELTGNVPDWLFWCKVGLLVVLLAAGLASRTLHPLRDFTLIFLVIMGPWTVAWMKRANLQ